MYSNNRREERGLKRHVDSGKNIRPITSMTCLFLFFFLIHPLHVSLSLPLCLSKCQAPHTHQRTQFSNSGSGPPPRDAGSIRPPVSSGSVAALNSSSFSSLLSFNDYSNILGPPAGHRWHRWMVWSVVGSGRSQIRLWLAMRSSCCRVLWRWPSACLP